MTIPEYSVSEQGIHFVVHTQLPSIKALWMDELKIVTAEIKKERKKKNFTYTHCRGK